MRNETRDDSIFSIPESIVTEIAERKQETGEERYKPSYVTRIINKSIASKDTRPYEHTFKKSKLKSKGHFMKTDEVFQGMGTTVVSITSEGSEVKYEGMVFPGPQHGEEIMATLDKKISQIAVDELTTDEKYKLCAFLTIITATTHAFPDANGRTAVGLAETYIKYLTNAPLNRIKLVEKNHELMSYMTGASLGLLPDYCNPNLALGDLEQDEKKSRTIKLPTVQNGYSDAQRKSFNEKYANSIKQFVNDFDVRTNQAEGNIALKHKLTYDYIQELAELYKEVSTRS